MNLFIYLFIGKLNNIPSKLFSNFLLGFEVILLAHNPTHFVINCAAKWCDCDLNKLDIDFAGIL
jgi:hypothetical protein